MEFKGDEIFLTENGIYEYTGVVHDDEKVYGRLANTDKEEECFKFSEVLSVWQEVDTGEKQCNLPVVVCSNCPKVIGLTVGKSYTQLAKHKDIIALVNDYGDMKRYNIAYFE